MRCVEVRTILSEYADGSTDPRGRRIADRHIQLCSNCEHQVVVYSRIAHQLRRLPLIPPGVADRLPRLRHDLMRTLMRRRRLGRMIRSLGLLALVVSAVALMLAQR